MLPLGCQCFDKNISFSRSRILKIVFGHILVFLFDLFVLVSGTQVKSNFTIYFHILCICFSVLWLYSVTDSI